jgi:hypothetical protein
MPFFYLFIEHVNHQNTLDCVSVHIGQTTDTKVAKGHPGEYGRIVPAIPCPEGLQGSHSPKGKTTADEGIEKEKLAKDIRLKSGKKI